MARPYATLADYIAKSPSQVAESTRNMAKTEASATDLDFRAAISLMQNLGYKIEILRDGFADVKTEFLNLHLGYIKRDNPEKGYELEVQPNPLVSNIESMQSQVSFIKSLRALDIPVSFSLPSFLERSAVMKKKADSLETSVQSLMWRQEH